jgi:hypothetical protein
MGAEFCRGVEELLQKELGMLCLNGIESPDGRGIEISIENPSTISPFLSVFHEAKVPVPPNANQARIKTTVHHSPLGHQAVTYSSFNIGKRARSE